MMIKKFFYFFLFMQILFSGNLFSKELELLNLKRKTVGQKETITLKFAGLLQERPTYKREGNNYSINIPNSKVVAKESEGMSFSSKGDHLLVEWNCEQLNNCQAIGSAGPASEYEFKLNGNELQLIYTINQVKTAGSKKIKTQQSLSYLMSSSNKNDNPEIIVPKKNEVDLGSKVEKTKVFEKVEKPKVTMFTSETKSQAKVPSFNFGSMQGYIIKIVLFLAAFIIFIIFGAKFFKRLISGKNKLNFLNSTQVVEVLNTTYLGPKRQLLLVRAHDQVVLLAAHETGVEFLCDVENLASVLKQQEKNIAGDNFDTSISRNSLREDLDQQVILKDPEKIYELAKTKINNKPKKTSSLTSLIKGRIQDLKAFQ
ncbi:MAG: flagellar biosynthetic protein FliO [Bacteriovoracaceae bacterium]|nr:flagellar biosynthetic protein FliO [Bacteriovoracaceae bacterium]